MMSFIPFPPQMIDWASVRASIPEEKYIEYRTRAYKKMKHMPHNMANCTAFWFIQWLKGIMAFMLTFQHFQGKISTEIATWNFKLRFNFSTVISYFRFQHSPAVLNTQPQFNHDLTFNTQP